VDRQPPEISAASAHLLKNLFEREEGAEERVVKQHKLAVLAEVLPADHPDNHFLPGRRVKSDVVPANDSVAETPESFPALPAQLPVDGNDQVVQYIIHRCKQEFDIVIDNAVPVPHHEDAKAFPVRHVSPSLRNGFSGVLQRKIPAQRRQHSLPGKLLKQIFDTDSRHPLEFPFNGVER